MSEPETEKKTSSSSSMILDCSLLPDSVSKLQMSTSPSVTKELKPDWSRLPEELIQLIPTYLEKNCSFVDAIHARSVCRSWRSTCPYPFRLLFGQNYCLPSLTLFPLCNLRKFPMFLFRVKTPPMSPPEYFLGGISHDDHHTELLQSPIQCSLKVNLVGSDPILMNMLDCQILPLGYRYKVIGWDPEIPPVAFVRLKEKGRRGGFVVLLNHSGYLLVLPSSEIRWAEFERISSAPCQDICSFRGKFYVIFLNGDIFVIDPNNLTEVIPLMPPQDLNSSKYLVPTGDDEELFLVEKIIPTPGLLDLSRLACRVSRLDEEAGEWVVVNDLGDRVLFIGQLGNVSCSGKELPDGCGLTRNSILFTNDPWGVYYTYGYGDGSFWRLSRENLVLILNSSPSVVALRVEKPNWSLLPVKLLQLISTHLEKNGSFVDIIHARSVCRLWRSTFPFPDLYQSYYLPMFAEFPRNKDWCTFKKIPLFLFRVVQTQSPHESPPPPSEYFFGGICREDHIELLSPHGPPHFLQGIGRDDESEDDYPESPPSPSEYFLGGIFQEGYTEELPSSLQCYVKAKLMGNNSVLRNMLDCQILPLGYHYKIMGMYPEDTRRSVSFLGLNNEEEEFVVLLNTFGFLCVLRSSEMRWIRIENFWSAWCSDIYTFRLKFYVIFQNGEIFIIDPYNPMEATPLMTPQDINSSKYLVPSRNDEELFLVEKINPTCRVSKLDEETGEWIVVSDLGDRVLIIGKLRNVGFSVKELSDDCGLSGNSILITDDDDSNVTSAYKFDDDLGFWRLSEENHVLILNNSPPMLALQVDQILDT